MERERASRNQSSRALSTTRVQLHIVLNNQYRLECSLNPGLLQTIRASCDFVADSSFFHSSPHVADHQTDDRSRSFDPRCAYHIYAVFGHYLYCSARACSRENAWSSNLDVNHVCLDLCAHAGSCAACLRPRSRSRTYACVPLSRSVPTNQRWHSL